MNKLTTLIVGIILGIIYYAYMKRKNISVHKKRIADIISAIAGLVIIYLGYNKYNDNILISLGTAIITEHILEFF